MTARQLVFLIGGLLLAAAPVLAHHWFSAEYDGSKPVKVAGVVTGIEWTNPHIWLYVDSKEEDGRVTHWGFSGAPPGVLMRRGITKDALKPGAVVNVEGPPHQRLRSSLLR